MSLAPEWIAVDWGTTRLRVWAMGPDGPLEARASDRGAGALARDAFEPALLALIGDWLETRPPVVACGMVGSRQGWAEAAYRETPCAPLAAPLARPRAADPRLAFHIAPGVKQSRPADVMRGEETQIAGFLAAEPDFGGALCLPGTHSKWVHVSAGEIVSFRTAMTGELFALLSERSALRHGLGGGGDWNAAAFAGAVEETIARPAELAARLFSIRAERLLDDLAPGAARARLSGLLIGAELAASRPYWLGRDIALIGDPGLCAVYEAALAAQGVAARRADGRAATLAGLAAARALIRPEEDRP